MKKLLIIFLVLSCTLAHAEITKEVERRLTIFEDGKINVLRVTKFVENEEVLARRNHRRGIVPTDDVSNEPNFIKGIANVVFTQERIDAYIAKQEAEEALLEE